jgi:diacylglycerol diphosphate phosphatase/phosphatidate phosphatase
MQWNTTFVLASFFNLTFYFYIHSFIAKLLHRTCVYLPLLLTALIYSRSTSSWICKLAGVSALLTALGICETLTHVLKYYVLRRRPNFYALCEWNGTACTVTSKKVLESQLSFPSGHSSIGWCGMTFWVLVLLGKMRLSSSSSSSSGGRRTRKVWTMWLVCLIPWSWAAYVAASRIVDRWHTASDVIAGTLLSIACATLSYHSVFPHVLSMQAGTSYAELDVRKNR